MVDEFYDRRNLSHELVQEILTEKFYDFIQAVIDQDQDKIKAMAEKRFAEKMIENLPSIKKSEINFERGRGKVQNLVKEDSRDFGVLRKNLISDIQDDYIVDSMIIKGVSSKRDENDCNYDYNKLKNMENQGMIFYMHKYFSGHMHYYLDQRYHNKLQRMYEITEKKNAEF